MPYVRVKGNQTAIVHGFRNAESGKVDQTTLFTFYSKAEAKSAMGDKKHEFRQMVQDQAPSLRFDWPKIEDALRAQLEHLPDLYNHREARVHTTFRSALCGITRELVVNDPQYLMSSARAISENRHELAYLRDLIDVRLRLCDQQPNAFNHDDPFHWRISKRRKEVPPEEWDRLATLYADHRDDEATALAQLLVECWPNFARGFNYLGLLALRCGDFAAAEQHLLEAIRVGRTLFPKRLPKSHYWSDHDSRPYIRALIYMTKALHKQGEAERALEYCDRLRDECGLEDFADCERVYVLISCARWRPAVKCARRLAEIFPEFAIPLAFASFESGEKCSALEYFVQSVLSFPRTMAILLQRNKQGDPATATEIHDHNHGVDMFDDLEAYLNKPSNKAPREFKRLMRTAGIKRLIRDVERLRAEENAPDCDRAAWFDKIKHMTSIEFARAQVKKLGL